MLIRSVSTPILKSWSHRQKDLSLELAVGNRIPVNRPVSIALSSNSWSTKGEPVKEISRTSSESGLRDFSKPKTKLFPNGHSQVLLEEAGKEEEERIEMSLGETTSFKMLLSCSDLNELKSRVDEGCALVGGGNMGGGGGRGGGGGGGGSNGGYGYGGHGHSGSDHGFGSIDAYYQKMIKAFPENALLLGNYARFLKEVKGDLEKAEEYCERAILAKPIDGNAYSLYGDLIWHTQKDGLRAETYFEQAVQSAPDDCYVLASSARFLWDSGQEEEVEEQEEHGINSSSTSTSTFVQGCAPHPPPLAAAS